MNGHRWPSSVEGGEYQNVPLRGVQVWDGPLPVAAAALHGEGGLRLRALASAWS
jgi:hypothetical protein